MTIKLETKGFKKKDFEQSPCYHEDVKNLMGLIGS